MLSHVTIGTNDPAAARRFYDAILLPLGWNTIHADEANGMIGYAKTETSTPQIWVMRPYDGRDATVGNGAMVALEAKARAAVDAFHATALAHGARDEGPAGLRPHYHANFYGAYVRDPEGNKLCCVCHRSVG